MSLPSSAVKFHRILAQFPQELSFAFAYGSGVFQQAGASAGESENNMLDFVFAVDDSVSWHKRNLSKNRSHYSFLKYFGAKRINNVQNYGAGIYYNTLVPSNGRVIKYGVISTDMLIEDLLRWKTLYVAGRLHKPVAVYLIYTLGLAESHGNRKNSRESSDRIMNGWNRDTELLWH
ncbi:UNVERIFIED_CONTAM: Phosphatidate cytidylyltransferase, mitochondrial [Gekko kuhli]